MLRSSPRTLAKTAFRWCALLVFAGTCSVALVVLMLDLSPQMPPQGPVDYGQPSAELIARFEDLVARETVCTLCCSLSPSAKAQATAAFDAVAAAQLAQWLLDQPVDPSDVTSNARYQYARRLYTIGAELHALGSTNDSERTLVAALALCDAALQQSHEEAAQARFDDLIVKAGPRLGALYAYAGKWARAERAYRTSIAAGQRLLAQQPENDDYRSALAATWVTLGDLYCTGNRTSDGQTAYQRAGPLLEALAQRHPEALSCHTMLARVSAGRAQLADSPQEALSVLSESIDRLKNVAARFPDDSAAALLLVQQSSGLLGLLLGSEHYPEAAATVPACVTLAAQTHARFPSAAIRDQYRLTLKRALLVYTICPLEELRDSARALETARALAELEASSSFRHTAMALAWNAKGDWHAAIEAATLANNQHPDPANFFCLAVAYSQLGDTKAAREAYKSAIELLNDIDDQLALDVYQFQRRETARLLGIAG